MFTVDVRSESRSQCLQSPILQSSALFGLSLCSLYRTDSELEWSECEWMRSLLWEMALRHSCSQLNRSSSSAEDERMTRRPLNWCYDGYAIHANYAMIEPMVCLAVRPNAIMALRKQSLPFPTAVGFCWSICLIHSSGSQLWICGIFLLKLQSISDSSLLFNIYQILWIRGPMTIMLATNYLMHSVH